MFQGSLKGFSRKDEACGNGVLSGIHGCLKEFQWVFEGSSKRVSSEITGSFNGI